MVPLRIAGCLAYRLSTLENAQAGGVFERRFARNGPVGGALFLWAVARPFSTWEERLHG
jgi:hypothetical protein